MSAWREMKDDALKQALDELRYHIFALSALKSDMNSTTYQLELYTYNRKIAEIQKELHKRNLHYSHALETNARSPSAPDIVSKD